MTILKREISSGLARSSIGVIEISGVEGVLVRYDVDPKHIAPLKLGV